MTTIQRRLTRTLLLVFGLPLIVGGAITFALIKEELVEQFDAALQARAQAVAAVIRIDNGIMSLDPAARVIDDFGVERDERDSRESERQGDQGEHADGYFQVRRLDGQSVLRSASLRSADLPSRAGSFDDPAIWDVTLPGGDAGRAVGFRFHPQAQAALAAEGAPELILVTAAARDDMDQTIAAIGAMLAGAGALLLAATFVVVPRVVRRAFRPIEQLANQAGQITAESLGTRFDTATLPGELTPIASRLNDLLGRLEASFNRERRFSGDLAHELRTPIAELRSLAELALKWPDARPADADRDSLAIALHMEGIVTRLLTLLRAEHGRLPVEPERIDLAASMRDIWRSIAPAAEGKSLRVSWQVPPGAAITTDPVLYRSIAANLLQNAVEYTPAGGAIDIETVGCDRQFEIRVTNDIDRLTPDDVSHLFDRLWRADPSRSGTEHAGLGLSLARSFAEALDCELTASLIGTRLRMILQSAAPTRH